MVLQDRNPPCRVTSKTAPVARNTYASLDDHRAPASDGLFARRPNRKVCFGVRGRYRRTVGENEEVVERERLSGAPPAPIRPKIGLAAPVKRALVLRGRAVEREGEAAEHGDGAERTLTARAERLLRPVARLVSRLRRSGAKRLRRFRAEMVELGTDFGLEGRTWDAHVRRRLVAEGLHGRIPQAAGEALSGRRLWLLLVNPTGHFRERAEAVLASLAGARALAERAPFGVTCLAVGVRPGGFADGPEIPIDFVPDLGAALARAEEDDLLAFLRPGDVLRPEFAAVALQRRAFEHHLVLVDGAMRQRGGGRDRAWPVLHPGLNHLHALNCDYFRSRGIVQAGAARAALARGARDVRAIILDVMERTQPRAHAVAGPSGPDSGPAGALHLDLPLLDIAETPDRIAAERAEMVRSRTSPAFPASPGSAPPRGPVSAVICTKDRGLLLRQLVDRLLEFPADRLSEVFVVRNGTSNPYALRTHEELAGDARVAFLDHQGGFNFSGQSNRGAAHSSGSHILLLNDDIVPVAADWLDHLLAPFVDPQVAIAGPLLLYPDERVQQAGMYLGYRGAAGHTLRSARLPEGDWMFLASAPRYVSAVTGAVMMVERGFWEAAGGLDIALSKTLQDVDLCMRARAAGRQVVYAPNAVLFHMESVSARETYGDPATAFTRRRELALFAPKLAAFGRDPFHNAAFDPDDETLHRLITSGTARQTGHRLP